MSRRRVRSAMTKSPSRDSLPLATVTSLRYRHDGLHVVAVGYTDRRSVKKKASPTHQKAKP